MALAPRMLGLFAAHAVGADAQAKEQVVRPYPMAQLSRGFWWSMLVALLWLGALRLCSGCGVDVEGAGDVEGGKRPRDVEQLTPLERDAGELAPDGQVDAPAIDAGAPLPDAHTDVALVAPPAPLAGRWRVALRRTHGSGCTGLPVAASELWEVSTDLATVTTPQGQLALLTAGMWELDGTPVLRFELEPGETLRGARVAEVGFCVEAWAVEGVRP